MTFNSTFYKPRAPMKRGTKHMRSGRSTSAPTVAEKAWMAFITEFGCVVCWLHHGVKTPCAVHHIVEGSRRLGHLFTLGLCDPGHHQNGDQQLKISRHPYKARFESEYGTEYELLAYLQAEKNKLEMKA
jgi:hypothetical protein